MTHLWRRPGRRCTAPCAQLLHPARKEAAYLAWAAQAVDWLHMAGRHWQRIGLVAATLGGAVALYLGGVAVLGLNLRQFVRR